MEWGVLFPEADKTMPETQKFFCFAEARNGASWDGDGQQMISREQVAHLDAIIQKVILEYF